MIARRGLRDASTRVVAYPWKLNCDPYRCESRSIQFHSLDDPPRFHGTSPLRLRRADPLVVQALSCSPRDPSTKCTPFRVFAILPARSRRSLGAGERTGAIGDEERSDEAHGVAVARGFSLTGWCRSLARILAAKTDGSGRPRCPTSMDTRT